MKTCSRCKQAKPHTSFTMDRSRRDGLNVWCRDCTRASNNASAKANRQVARERGARWYAANKKRKHEAAKAWLAANPGKSAEYSRRYKEKHPDRLAASMRKHYLRNRERLLEQDRLRRQENLASFLERERVSYRKNAAARAARARSWRQANKDLVAFYASERRSALLTRTPKWLTHEHFRQMRAVFTKAKRLSVSTGIAHHVDHIVPLRGRRVSGLNVPWNMRAIPWHENLSKSNSHAA